MIFSIKPIKRRSPFYSDQGQKIQGYSVNVTYQMTGDAYELAWFENRYQAEALIRDLESGKRTIGRRSDGLPCVRQ